jgi:hypothetical protein
MVESKMIQRINPSMLEYKYSIQNLCRAPFHGHPKGCPNYGRKESCPPDLLLIDELLDLHSDMYVIYTEFPVGKFAERMRIAHPEWSKHPRQWYNPRLWQETARKEHRREIMKFMNEYPALYVSQSPEAHGVVVSSLMKQLGIELNWDWPPAHSLENKVYRISLAGYKV